MTVLSPGLFLFMMNRANFKLPLMPRIVTELSVIAAFMIIGVPVSLAAF